MFDNKHYRIDLVFYHRILKCHILIAVTKVVSVNIAYTLQFQLLAAVWLHKKWATTSPHQQNYNPISLYQLQKI